MQIRSIDGKLDNNRSAMAFVPGANEFSGSRDEDRASGSQDVHRGWWALAGSAKGLSVMLMRLELALLPHRR